MRTPIKKILDIQDYKRSMKKVDGQCLDKHTIFKRHKLTKSVVTLFGALSVSQIFWNSHKPKGIKFHHGFHNGNLTLMKRNLKYMMRKSATSSIPLFVIMIKSSSKQ